MAKKSNTKKQPKWNSNAQFRGALRRAFAKSPSVRKKMDENRRESSRYNKDGSISKIKKVEFQCEICGNWFMRKHTAIDHVDPVINPETGFVDWNTFIERLDCDISNLQCICSYTKKHEDSTKEFGTYSCHYKKTQEEASKLRELKDKLKNESDV